MNTCVDPALLVLNTFDENSIKELYLAVEDEISTDLKFGISDGIDVHQSCSVTLNNRMFVFGGKSQGL